MALAVWLRRAAALLLKAAAAAASGKLQPSCACIDCILRWRKAPSLLILHLQMALSHSISLQPAAELLRLLDVGAGKQRSRARFFIA